MVVSMENAIIPTTKRPAPYPSERLLWSFADYLDRKPATIRGYIKCLRVYARWCSENGITNPTRDDLRSYRDSLAARGLSATTQRTYLQAARALHRWAAWKLGCEDIGANLHGPRVRTDIHHRDALSPEEVRAVLSAIDTTTETGIRTLAICELAAIDGMRTVEIVRADVRDLQTVGGRRYLAIQGKGHDAKDQLRSLTPRVAEAVDEYLKMRSDSWDGASPLFVSTSNRNRGGRMTTASVSSTIKRAMRAAGFDSPRLTAHSMRHTAATAAIEAGMGLREVQSLMGHASPTTTEVYVHERDERRIEDVGRSAIEAHLLGEAGVSEARLRIADAVSRIDDTEMLSRIEAFINRQIGER